MERNKRKFDLGVSITIFAIACFLLFVSYHTKIVPVSVGLTSMDFPRIIFAAILIFCVLHLTLTVIWFVKNPVQAATEPKEPLIDKKIGYTAILICLYAASWQIIGFSLGTLLFFYIQTKVLCKEKPALQVALVSIVTVIAVNLIFVKIFKIDFPEPLFILLRGY